MNRDLFRAVRLCKDPMAFVDPLQLYAALRERYGARNAFLLESLHGPARDMRSAYIGFDPVAEVRINGHELSFTGRGVFAEALATWARNCPHLRRTGAALAIEPGRTWEVLRSLHSALAPPYETSIGFLTFLGYDAAWHIEKLPCLIGERAKLPDFSLVLHRALVAFDLQRGAGVIEQFVEPGCEPVSGRYLELAAHALGRRETPPAAAAEQLSDTITKDQYLHAASQCLEHISAGDIYQIQLGHELRIASPADPFEVYLRLRRINPSPYMYFAPVADAVVVGASPELFVRKEGRGVTMRPIAGTMRRTGDDERDRLTAEALRGDEKERAEHIMLIDLCRNDLGRVCQAGTLQVDERMTVEQYSHVLHLVSNVQAKLAAERDIYDLIAATFPAGTMTGAPKIRAMELIESFETTRRGLYAGAIGLISLGGDAVLALCIRTAVYAGRTYSIRASAGIVADSRPESEWQETLNKLAAGFIAITGEDFHASYRGGATSKLRSVA
jgi:anthranilate synthase component 1